VSERAAEFLGRPLDDLNTIVLHLGNGGSVTAVRGGRAIDTSLGMSTMCGLVMGTRAGDLDPGVILELQRKAYGVWCALIRPRAGDSTPALSPV
jgi:acetate kinase